MRIQITHYCPLATEEMGIESIDDVPTISLKKAKKIITKEVLDVGTVGNLRDRSGILYV